MRARSQGMRSGSRGVDWSTNTSRTPDESSLVGPGILRSLGRSSGVRWPSAGGHVPSASKDVRPWRRPLSEGGRGRFTYTMPALRQAGVVLAERLLAGEHVELQGRRDAREFKRLERRQSSSRHVDAPFAERTRSVAWFGSTTLTSRPRRVSSSATTSRAWRIASRLEAGEGRLTPDRAVASSCPRSSLQSSAGAMLYASWSVTCRRPAPSSGPPRCFTGGPAHGRRHLGRPLGEPARPGRRVVTIVAGLALPGPDQWRARGRAPGGDDVATFATGEHRDEHRCRAYRLDELGGRKRALAQPGQLALGRSHAAAAIDRHGALGKVRPRDLARAHAQVILDQRAETALPPWPAWQRVLVRGTQALEVAGVSLRGAIAREPRSRALGELGVGLRDHRVGGLALGRGLAITAPTYSTPRPGS
jgi:hypothetical protein